MPRKNKRWMRRRRQGMISSSITTCEAKTEQNNVFHSYGQAEAVAKKIRRRTRAPVVPFHCDFCHRWHVGYHHN